MSADTPERPTLIRRAVPRRPVATTHIQQLIRTGLELAEYVDGAGNRVMIDDAAVPTIDCLEKAAADLRHAAEELTAERLALLGWPQS